MPVPKAPKLYHIVHIDRVPSIIKDGRLWCDSKMAARSDAGTMIGIPRLKERRLRNVLGKYPELCVGDCVPFYFCPRSVMLYVIHKGNHSALTYKDGQERIVHLEADMHDVVEWANGQGRKWVFTDSNAGSSHFEDWRCLSQLDRIDWTAVQSRMWQDCKDKKQAEFLIEKSFPWELVKRIGVQSREIRGKLASMLKKTSHRPNIEVKNDWYY